MKISECGTVFICLFLLAACGTSDKPYKQVRPTPAATQAQAPPPPPPQNIVSREDITDFCDAIPRNAGGDTDRSTKLTAEMLGANSKQVAAMSFGAALARGSASASEYAATVRGSANTQSFQAICRISVRKQLSKLRER